MTMAISFHTSVESCGSGHGISSKEEEVWHSSPKQETVETTAIFLPSSVESCGGGRGISSREMRRSALPISEKKEG